MLISCCTVADGQVVEYVSVSVSVSKLDTLLRGNVDFHSTNEAEVLIIAGWSVEDARVVKYVSKSETLLHSCNSNRRRVSIGRSSSASPRKLIPVDRGSPYAASWVVEGLSSLNV